MFLPLTVSVCGPPAGIGSSVTGHLPSSPALAVLVWPAIVTVTSSPGSAQPQTRSFCSRCRTMWLPKIAGSFTSARCRCAMLTTARAATRARFIAGISDGGMKRRDRQHDGGLVYKGRKAEATGWRRAPQGYNESREFMMNLGTIAWIVRILAIALSSLDHRDPSRVILGCKISTAY